MWSFQVRSLERMTPRYLTELTWGIGELSHIWHVGTLYTGVHISKMTKVLIRTYGTSVLSLIPWLLWAQLSSAGWEVENKAKSYPGVCTVPNSVNSVLNSGCQFITEKCKISLLPSMHGCKYKHDGMWHLCRRSHGKIHQAFSPCFCILQAIKNLKLEKAWEQG